MIVKIKKIINHQKILYQNHMIKFKRNIITDKLKISINLHNMHKIKKKYC